MSHCVTLVKDYETSCGKFQKIVTDNLFGKYFEILYNGGVHIGFLTNGTQFSCVWRHAQL